MLFQEHALAHMAAYPCSKISSGKHNTRRKRLQGWELNGLQLDENCSAVYSWRRAGSMWETKKIPQDIIISREVVWENEWDGCFSMEKKTPWNYCLQTSTRVFSLTWIILASVITVRNLGVKFDQDAVIYLVKQHLQYLTWTDCSKNSVEN